MTSNTGPILVFPSDPTFRFRCIFVSWKSVLTTSHCICRLWEILWCLSSWNTVQFQQHSEILHPYNICSICLVLIAFQFVLYVQDHYISKARLSWSHLAQTKNLDCPPTTGFPRSIMKGFIFFTHFCDCTVKTELIYRSNCAKNSFKRFLVSTIVDGQFSTAFAFERSSGPMGSWLERLGVRFLRVSPSSFPPFCPIHLVDYLHW